MTTLDPPDTASGPRARWVLPGAATAAIGGPLALAVTNAAVALTPGYADAGSTAEVLEVAREHAGLLQAGSVVSLLAAALLVPGTWAVASRLAGRTPRLAAVGGWAMATGYVFFVALPVETLVAVSVASAGDDAAAYVEGVDQHMTPVAIAMYAVFGLGALGGGLVLGIAMLRQRDLVPAWAGWALVASEPVRVLGLVLGVPPGPPLASLLIAVAFYGVVRGRR